MKLKFLLSTLILVLVVGVSASQLSAPVSAFNSNPITSPVTSAMQTLSGWVKYWSDFHFKGADGAMVMAKDGDGNTFSTTADADGKYELSVPKGRYDIWVDESGNFANYRFLPVLKNFPLWFNFHLTFFGIPKH